MHAGVSAKGLPRIGYNTSLVRNLLERVPTEPRTGGGHVPFVIAERSIDQWVGHLKQSEDGAQKSSPVSSVSTVAREEGHGGSQGGGLEEWTTRTNRVEDVIPSPTPVPSKSPVVERNPLLNQLEAWCEQNDDLSSDPDLEISQTFSSNDNPDPSYATTKASRDPRFRDDGTI
jgi:hypothetical protein